MILSRTLAKQRMAADVRPSFVGAWGLVLIDLLLVGLLVWLTFPLFYQWATVNKPNPATTIGLIFILFFVPTQFFLILSALWAAKSRWVDMEPPQG